MTFEATDFYLTDASLARMPLSGVVMRTLSEDGRVIWNQAITGADGHVGLLLPTGRYQARFYKQQVTFQNPLLFEVLETPAVNTFDVVATVFTLPASTDARLCIAYGFFRDISGAPARGVDVQFHARFRPLILDGAGVLTATQSIRTDEKGYAEISLIKCGQYDVVVQGAEDTVRRITVPEAVNVNLPDLLFPVVDAVLLNPLGPYTLAVGEEIVVVPTILTSDENILPGIGLGDVSYKSSDPNILAVLPSGINVTLRGLAPGVARLHLDRLDASVVRYPDPGIRGNDVLVTVSG